MKFGYRCCMPTSISGGRGSARSRWAPSRKTIISLKENMQKKIDLKSMILGSALAAAVMLSVAAVTPNQEQDRSSATTGSNQMERVNGIGGVFFKARDPKKMAAWYRDHLGIQSKGGFAIFN